jgi:glycosyltransferase involved in cell wall biosynthesis
MKVAFDAYWWLGGPPSGRNVVRSMVKTWVTEFPEDDVTIFVRSRDLKEVRGELGPGSRVSVVGRRVLPHLVSAISSPRRGHDAVITQNFGTLRPGAGLRAVFVHDLIFIEHREWFTRAELVYLAPLTWLARRQDLIFTSSQAEAARIRRHLQGPPVRAVGLGLPADFASAGPRPWGAGAVKPNGYILTVGRLNARKNVAALVGALVADGVLSREMPLVVVGEADGRGVGRTAHPEGLVLWAGGVSNSELKWLYQNARLFVFPSLDEGFGLPVLEASASGAPIVASDIDAFRELGLRELFDPRDELDIARVVRAALRRHDRTPGVVSNAASVECDWHQVVQQMRTTIERKVSGLRPEQD